MKSSRSMAEASEECRRIHINGSAVPALDQEGNVSQIARRLPLGRVARACHAESITQLAARWVFSPQRAARLSTMPMRRKPFSCT